MPVPLGLALPAAAAGLAYVNARTSWWYDSMLLTGAVSVLVPLLFRERAGRVSFFYVLEERAQSKAEAQRPFMLFKDRTWTYAQAHEMALRYGHWLKTRLDVKKGDIIALDFMNSDDFIFLTFGLWAIGAKPAFINYNLTGNALVHCVRAAKAGLLIADPAVAASVNDEVRSQLPGVQVEIFDLQRETAARSADPVREPDEVRYENKQENMAILIYTSGTTGLPKPAIVSWAKLHVGGRFSAKLTGIKPGDVYYTCMPLYHSSATVMCLATVLTSGATIGVGVRFNTKNYWAEARRFNATMVQYVGETCRYLLAAPPQIDPATGENLDKKHKVRLAFGNGLRPDVWKRFKERFGVETILEFYGSTEGSFATWNLSRNDFSAGAVGRSGWLYGAVIGRTAAMVAVDFATDMPWRDPRTGLCRRTPAGQPGEFIFKLPAQDIEKRFQGYYGNEQATAAKIIRDVFEKGDAWFRTGDVMRRDDEGRMYFNDRIGDTFRWKSENVSTAEVSEVMGLHPAVQEANVYGVQVPHHDGRAGCVAIVLSQEPTADLLRSLADHAQRRLPRYALPLFLRVTKEPGAQTTGTNKQQKHVLRQQGVSPQQTGGDDIFWLKDGTYAKFGDPEWNELNGGRVKL